MWPNATLRSLRMMWATASLTAAYALIIALALYSSHSPTKADDLLVAEGLFAGPIIISAILTMLMRRIEARLTLLVFGFGYSILTAAVFYWTFGFEHDAQYQLMLLFIPMLGYPAIVIAGLTAMFR